VQIQKESDDDEARGAFFRHAIVASPLGSEPNPIVPRHLPAPEDDAMTAQHHLFVWIPSLTYSFLVYFASREWKSRDCPRGPSRRQKGGCH
jgi:hypothetical protein